MNKSPRTSRLTDATLLPHLLAMTLSMGYAWGISQTAYVTTSVQFISPLLVIILVHLAWMLATRSLEQGYAQHIFYRSFVSGLALAFLVPLIEVASPMSSRAGPEMAGVFDGFLVVLFCLVVLAAVVAIAGGAMYLLISLLAFIGRAIWRTGAKNGRMNDIGALVAGFFLIAGTSLEGIPGFFHFEGRDSATASVRIDAEPAQIWEAMQTATAADFPLPAAIQMFPRPVEVLVDEGTDLGANRIVVFEGREGRGQLHLRVVERIGMRSVFEMVSDTTPLSRWAAIESITYDIVPVSEGSELHVTLNYERLLAPSWVFTPMMNVAAQLSMGVLARDTKERAEIASTIAG